MPLFIIELELIDGETKRTTTLTHSFEDAYNEDSGETISAADQADAFATAEAMSSGYKLVSVTESAP